MPATDRSRDSKPPRMSQTYGEKQSYERDQEHYNESDDIENTDSWFDWQTDEPLDDHKLNVVSPLHRQKLLPRIVYGVMRWPRWLRMSLVGIFGGAICLIPLIVVVCAFSNSPARSQVEVWSVWLTIIWITTIATFLVFSWFPKAILKVAELLFSTVPDHCRDAIRVVDGAMLYIKLMFCCVWAWASLGGTLAIQYKKYEQNGRTIDPRPDYFNTIDNLVRAFFASSVVLLAEKLALQLIVLHFHKTSFRDRLDHNRNAFKVLAKLQGSLKLPGISSAAQLRSRVTNIGNGARNTLGLGLRSGKTSGSVTPTPAADSANQAMRSRKPAFASQLQTALATAAKRAQLSDINSPESSLAARRLAKELFLSISKDGVRISQEDFAPYFKDQQRASDAFRIFDQDQSGEISREEMRTTLQEIFEERAMLNGSIQDMRSAFRNLDSVLLFLALIVVIFIWLLIFTGSQGVSNLLPLSTIILGFSFVFGNSAKNIFESMIFIFSTHPYDVGDLVCIGDTWMFVTAFGMISTHFVTVFNQVVIAPNAELASGKPIFNARRSGAQWDVINLQVGFDTPVKKIDQLREGLTEFCQANDKKWGGGLELLYDSVRNMNSIGLIVAVQHKNNWQNWLARWNNRDEFMKHIKNLTQELGITYQPPTQPISFMPQQSGAQPTIRYENDLLPTMQVPLSTSVPSSSLGQTN
ncbi:hypothetical protein MPSI1_003250 [Malassezia psittaci]|uniref:EF-hand domain-containing protein n=1 Tax=Malassezia psittaci TaxID=1821823 RepID=A0AAF0FC36_9BASI|nr:hypothetical protein MPSI1_003250 [Malassezia psittaci]